MRLTEDIKPITDLKTRSAELVRSVRESRRPLVITQHGEASAVLMDIASYEELRSALMMLRLVAESETAARRGRTVSHSAAMDRLRAAVAGSKKRRAKKR